MAEKVRGARGRRGWMWAAGAAAAALVVGGAAAVVLLDRSTACGCENPDAGLDVGYGALVPGDGGAHSRLEVVEVAAVDGYTRTVLRFSHTGEEAEAFDPAYFTGGAAPGDGFRIWDPATGRLYANQAGLGTVTGDEVVWEPRTHHDIVLFSAPLEPGTGEVELRGPRGEFRIRGIGVRDGSGDARPLWTPEAAEEGAEDGGTPETVVLPFTASEPGAGVPGYTEVFAPPAPEPVNPVPAAAEVDERGRARAQEGGRAWFLSVAGYEVEDGVLHLEYRLEAEDGEAPARRPDLFPGGIALLDPATGAVVPELRVGDPEGESEPLWTIAWPRLTDDPPRTFGELSFAAPEGAAGGLLLDAGVFGALPVEPRG
ncbi:hypothetical protein SUDANB121_01329 [Nocardiopsis dassonvillei]|uniref:hypothetical protein n=1 Tax=Nocardiopsis dassonvillei TaxID=2014 RepID=UPI003F576214